VRIAPHIFICLLIFAGSLFAQPDMTWSRVIGTSNQDNCYSIQQTDDGGYIAAGKTTSPIDANLDYYLIKMDSEGVIEWERTYGGDDNEWCHSVRQTSDGGFVLGGYIQYLGSGEHDMWLVKVDGSGEMEWDHTYGGDGHEACHVVRLTSDGGYILGGKSNSLQQDIYRMYVVKTDASGDTLWTRSYPTGDWCNTIESTSEGGYICGGGGWQGVCMVKIGSTGSLQWQRSWRGGTYFEDGSSIVEVADGGFVLAGYKGRNDPNLYLVKTSAEGDTLWSRIHGEDAVDHCYSMIITGAGNYILAGFTTSYDLEQGAGFVAKANSDGYLVWTQTFSGNASRLFNSVRQSSDGGLILAGTVFDPPNDEFFIVKTGLDGTFIEEDNNQEIPDRFAFHPAYPNPFNPQTNLAVDLAEETFLVIEVFNVLGERVDEIVKGHYAEGRHTIRLDGRKYTNGIYFVRAIAGNWQSQLQKVILLK